MDNSRLFKKFIGLILGFSMMITSTVMIAASDNKDIVEQYNNNDVLSVTTISYEQSEAKVRFKVDTLQEGVNIKGILDDQDILYPVDTEFTYTKNGLYKLRLVYDKTFVPFTETTDGSSEAVSNETKESEVLRDLELAMSFELKDIVSQVNTRAFMDNGFEIRPISNKSIKDTVSIGLSDKNAAFLDTSDFEDDNTKESEFLLELKLNPNKDTKGEQKFTLSIPKGFALTQDTLETLGSGQVFSDLNVDYAGVYNSDTKLFSWYEGKFETIVTMTLNDEVRQAIAFDIKVYQDFNYVNTNVESAKVDYNFILDSNLNDKVSSLKMTKSFASEGLYFTPGDSNGIKGSVDESGNSLFTFTDARVLYENWDGLALPKAVKPIKMTMNLNKLANNYPVNNFVAEIPIPYGYELYLGMNELPRLVAPNGNNDGELLDINVLTTSGWFIPQKASGSRVNDYIRINLSKDIARGLLQNFSSEDDEEAAVLTYYIKRVDYEPDGPNCGYPGYPECKMYDLAYDRNGETLVSDDFIRYFNTPYDNSAQTSYQKGKLAISYPYEESNEMYNFDFPNVKITKTRQNVKLGPTFVTDDLKAFNVRKGYIMAYSFPDMTQDFLDRNPITLFNDDLELDKNAYILIFSRTSDQLQTYDLYKSSTADKKVLQPLTLTEDMYGIGIMYTNVLKNPDNVFDFMDVGMQISTDNKPNYNNEEESFTIVSNVNFDWNPDQDNTDSAITKYTKVTLVPRTNQIVNTLDDFSDTTIAMGQAYDEPYMKGNLVIPDFYTSIENARLDINPEDDVSALQFAAAIQVSGKGMIEYKINGDDTLYTMPYENNAINDFAEVDYYNEEFITDLSIVPDGFDDNLNGNEIEWSLYLDDRVPNEIYRNNDGEIETIEPDLLESIEVSSVLRGGANQEIIAPSTNGKTPQLKRLMDSVVAVDTDNSSQIIQMDSKTEKPLFTMGTALDLDKLLFEGKDFGLNYLELIQGVDTSTKDIDNPKDFEGLLAMVNRIQVKITNDDGTSGQNLTLLINVLNTLDGSTRTIRESLDLRTSSTFMYEIDLSDEEVVSDFSYSTDLYYDGNRDAQIALEFFTNQMIKPITPLGTTLKDQESIAIPMYMATRTAVDYGNKISQFTGRSATFEGMNDLETYLESNFKMEQLNTNYTSADEDFKFAFIEDNRPFDKPVLSTNFSIEAGYESMYDARLELDHEEASKLYSIIGSMNIKSIAGDLDFVGTVEYQTYNESTNETQNYRVEVDALNQDIAFDMSDDEYLINVIVYIDDMNGVQTKNTYQFNYYLKNKMSQTQFREAGSLVDIPDGYFLGNDQAITKAQFKLSYTAGGNAKTTGSSKGTSISFYEPEDKFILTPNKNVETLRYFKGYEIDERGESLAGFEFKNYRESKTYEDVTFSLDVDEENKALLTLTDGILIGDSLGSGWVQVSTNKTEREYAFVEGTQTLKFDLDADEWVTELKVFFNTLPMAKTQEGHKTSVYLLIMNDIQDAIKDGTQLLKPTTFDYTLTFDGSEKIEATQMGKSAVVGTLEDPGTLKDYPLWFTSSQEKIMEQFSEVSLGQRQTFAHYPKIGWETVNRHMAPDTIKATNFKLYYVISDKFDYVEGSAIFINNSETEVEVKTSIKKIEGKSEYLLIIEFEEDYSHTLTELKENDNASGNFALGTVAFRTILNSIEANPNMTAVLASYIDLGYNVAFDESEFGYTHDTSQYLNLYQEYGIGSEHYNQFLEIGKGQEFSIVAPENGTVYTRAKSNNYNGLSASGTYLSDFGEEVNIVTTNEGMDVYIPIPRKDLSFDIDINNQVKSEFDMFLQGPLQISNPNNIKYTVRYSESDYSKDKSDFGTYDPAKRNDYTMVLIELEDTNDPGLLAQFTLPLASALNRDVQGMAQSAVSYKLKSETEMSLTNTVNYKVNNIIISGTVWHDRDNNQVLNYDGLDQIMTNYKVTLTDLDDEGIVYTIDQADISFGRYQFDVPGGRYRLQVYQGDYLKDDELIFVKPNNGLNSNSSHVDEQGIKIIDARDVGEVPVNAGYRYNLDGAGAILEDVVMWVGDTEIIETSNPYHLNVSIHDQEFINNEGEMIARVIDNIPRIEAYKPGSFNVIYSYPNTDGATVTTIFKVTVKERYDVTYAVLNQGEGILVAHPDNDTADPMNAFLEYVRNEKQPEDNKVQFVPDAIGNTNSEGRYIFDGWLLENGTQVDLDTYKVNKDTVFYASFALDTTNQGIADKYKVKFTYLTEDGLGNGNTGLPIFSETVVRYIDPSLEGEALNDISNLDENLKVSPLTLQAIPQTKEGYDFKQWLDEDGNAYSSEDLLNTQFDKDTVFTADYELKNYIVKYEVASGFGTLSPANHEEIVSYGESVKELPQPIKETVGTVDYIFDSWVYEDGTEVDFDTFTVSSDITLYAKFGKDTTQDGILDIYQVRFEYITLDNKGNGNIIPKPFVEYVTRYIDPTLTGEALNAKENLSQDIAVSPKTAQSNPDTSEAYQFVQWSDGTRTYLTGEVILQYTFSDDTVFTAEYQKYEYKVKYELETDIGILEPEGFIETVEHGDVLQEVPLASNQVVDGLAYIFDTWVLEDGTPIDISTYRIQDNQTLYARYEKDTNNDGIADVYQVRFEYRTLDDKGNGNVNELAFTEYVTRYIDPTLEGDELNDPSNLSRDKAVNPLSLQDNPKTTTGYDFVQWIDQNDRSYDNGQTILNTLFAEDTIFTAVYTRQKFEVTYALEDDFGSLDPDNHKEAVLYGDTVQDVPKTNKQTVDGIDYIFDTWVLEDGTKVDLNTYKVLGNVTLYARFGKDTSQDGILDIYQVRFEYRTSDGLGNGSDDVFVEYVTRYIDPTLPEDERNHPDNLSKTASVKPTQAVQTPFTMEAYQFDGWITNQTPNRTYTNSEAILQDEFNENEIIFTAQYSKVTSPNPPTEDKPTENEVVKPGDANQDGTLPGTGIESDNTMLYAVLSVLSGCFIILFKRRKKSIQKHQ